MKMNKLIKSQVSKLFQAQRNNIEFVKTYLEQQVVQRRLADFVTFVELKDDEFPQNIDLECRFDCGGFETVIIYSTVSDVSADLNVEFIINHCEERFTIYDIFDLFEIYDFNDYAQSECFDENSIRTAVDNLLSLVEKYAYDLKNAAKAENFERLCHQYEKEPEKIKEFDKLIWLERWMKSRKSEKSKQAFIKALEKREAEGNLTEYYKRYLRYLKAGGDVSTDTDVLSNHKKIFTRYYFLTAFLLDFLSVAFMLLLHFAGRYVLFGTEVVVFDESWLSSLILPFLAGMSLGYLLARFFIYKILFKICPDTMKNYVELQEKRRYADVDFSDRIWAKYLLPAVSVGAIAIFFVLFNYNTAFYHDYIKLCRGWNSSDIVKYDEVTLYDVKGYFDEDEDGKYKKYEDPYYVIGYADDFYLIGEVDSKNQQKKFDTLFSENHVKSIQVESEEDIENYFDGSDEDSEEESEDIIDIILDVFF